MKVKKRLIEGECYIIVYYIIFMENISYVIYRKKILTSLLLFHITFNI